MNDFWNGFEKRAGLAGVIPAIKAVGSRVGKAWSGQAGRGVMNQTLGAGKALARSAGSAIKANPGKAMIGGMTAGALAGRASAPSMPTQPQY